MIVETPRLKIRKLAIDDAEFILGLVNEPSFLANIGDKGVRTLDDAQEFILDGPWRRNQKPGYGQFMVELKPDGVPIGVCGLLYRERLDLTDIGCAFLPAYWRQGIAFEAATAVMEYGRIEPRGREDRRADVREEPRIHRPAREIRHDLPRHRQDDRR